MILEEAGRGKARAPRLPILSWISFGHMVAQQWLTMVRQCYCINHTGFMCPCSVLKPYGSKSYMYIVGTTVRMGFMSKVVCACICACVGACVYM